MGIYPTSKRFRLTLALGSRVPMLDGPFFIGRHIRIFPRRWALPYWRWGYGLLSFGAGPIGVMWWPR